MVSWVILLYILMLAVAVVVMHVMATLTIDLQVRKGYKAKYWIGFVFGPLAWLYYLAMPDLKIQKAIQQISEKLNSEDKESN